jgi:hypothetical protein
MVHEGSMRRQFQPTPGKYAASYGEDDGVVIVNGMLDGAVAFMFDCDLRFKEVQ